MLASINPSGLPSEDLRTSPPQTGLLDPALLLEAIGAPALLCDAAGLILAASDSSGASPATLLIDHLPDVADALLADAALPPRVERTRLSANRILVVDRRDRTREEALADLDVAGTDAAVAHALVRLARTEGCAAAAVVMATTASTGPLLACDARPPWLPVLPELALRISLDAPPPPLPGSTTHTPRLAPLRYGTAPQLWLATWGGTSDAHARLVTCGTAQLRRARTAALLEQITLASLERATAFGTIVENVPEALWLLDTQGTVQVANQAAHMLLGPLVTNLRDLRHFTQGPIEALAMLDAGLVSGEGCRVSIALKGRRRVDLAVSPVRGANGGLEGFVASARDVTTLQLRLDGLEALIEVAEVAAQPRPPAALAAELVEVIRRAFGAEGVGLWLRSGTAELAAAPDAVAGDVGDLRTSVVFHQAHAENRPTAAQGLDVHRQAVPVALAGGTTGILAVRTAGRSRRPHDDNARGMHLLGALVSRGLELAHSWEEVEEARAMLVSALDALPDAVMVTDTEGRVREANDAARGMLTAAGASPASSGSAFLAGLRLKDPSGERLPDLVNEALAGHRLTVDATFEEQGNAEPVAHALTVHAIPLREGLHGKSLGAMVVAHDVTRARELERMKDAFLSLAAHELRTPLAAMKTWAHLTQRDVTRGDLGRVSRAVAGIERQADKMGRMVSDLLDVSRLTGGRLILRTARVDLVQIVHQSLAQVDPTSPDHAFDVDVAHEIPIEGDETRLEQVVTNLLTNAVRYSPGGGEVRVRAFTVNTEAIVEVTDRGVGIAPEKLPRLFERFFRAHDDPHLGGGGLGLGLWITRELVQRHGGRVEVESAVGVGSTFRLRLPLLAS